uniref:Uncharacterized protein n=1 Tax=Oncorhynchus mykiss TaxID=8022 RepID=A0A8K9WZU0_ONCMY
MAWLRGALSQVGLGIKRETERKQHQSTTDDQAIVHRLPSLAGEPALGRVLVVPNFFHLIMMETSVFLAFF